MSQRLAPVIIGKLLNIGSMLQRNGNRMLLPYDLNQQQFSIFYEIAKAGKIKQKDMVNRLTLEKAHVSKVVKKLQNMEVITSSSSEEDKRSAWLSPTPRGEEMLKSCMEMFKAFNSVWMADIGEEQLPAILNSLELLQKVFKHHMK